MSSQAIEDRRQAEFDKYDRCYRVESYKMGVERVKEWTDYLRDAEADSRIRSVLDVGCGRAESLDIAERAGFGPVHGLEVVESLVGGRVYRMEGIHNLPVPDNSYDLVACQDVLEHILEEDVPAGLRELVRVARHRLYVSVAWFPSTWRSAGVNEELHICRHETQWWVDQLAFAASVRQFDQVRVLKPYRASTARLEVLLSDG